MFRASPWISYDPSNTGRNDEELQPNSDSFRYSYHMSEDVDMDAPQISTLREEDSPPPVRTSKFRVKLLVNENKGAPSSSPSKQTTGESEEEEEEEEEDQLIDDDDDVKPMQSSASHGSLPAARNSAKRKQAPKRPKKEKAPAPKGRTKSQEGYVVDSHIAGHELPLPMPQMHEWDSISVGSTTPSIATPVKKKPGPKKGSTRGRGRGITKTSSARSNPLPLPHVDDGETLSEIYPGTAPSSPGPQEDELDHLSISGHVLPTLEEFGLENVPLPLYPLPNKPFPVQPPVKVGTGFAPVLPLDKTGKKVRHWRQAQREIRGIAGGRWFIRSWVGDKDSELLGSSAEKAAPLHLAPEAATLALPKLSALALQGHSSSGKAGPKGKGMSAAAALSTAASSRSASAVPDLHVPREPSKMRTSVAAYSREASPSEAAEPMDLVQS
ncbi:hypothetical protein NEOLEDRAFT_95267 [Neolentinus lepideus HHB14362 ss-1]|uniref:Uncharacterized protein n=1 Tax=Neolentinus lepideus HHB14362 ss-1 TaxID=1314782 RepID=A0A165U2H8_9AGAM|nr:hypothetical protein NEOLEDRAFT_95267 [Neolentinus lepideus HHB14362 ss-1]